MTYADYITSALRMAGVLMETESATAEQGASGLEILNDMMAEWQQNGILLGYVPTDDTTADLNLHASVRSPVKANLAVRLAAIYPTVAVSGVVGKLAMDGYSDLLMQAAIDASETADMRHLPAAAGNFDVISGSIL